MRTYLAEGYLPETAASELPALGERLAAVCEAVSRPGRTVNYLHALRVPDDELCLYVFTASCAEAVEEVLSRAGLRHTRVSEAMVS